MPEFSFEREARTPHSESWVINADTDAIGRVDVHFAGSGIVRATLCVPPSFDDEAIEELIAEIDERLVLPVDEYRDDFIVTVWRGERVGVFSEELDGEDEDVDENGNGANPRAYS